MMYASGNIYRDLKEQAEGREDDSKFNYNFTREDKEKIAKEGRKFVYDEMNAIYAAISNEARKIVADFKGDASVMRIMAFLSRGKAFKDSAVGKLFKEEFAQMICRKSETSEVHYELYGMGSLVASEATGKIIVKNGEAWTQDGLFVDDVDLVDGDDIIRLNKVREYPEYAFSKFRLCHVLREFCANIIIRDKNLVMFYYKNNVKLL